jgi:hypothetical protein
MTDAPQTTDLDQLLDILDSCHLRNEQRVNLAHWLSVARRGGIEAAAELLERLSYYDQAKIVRDRA